MGTDFRDNWSSYGKVSHSLLFQNMRKNYFNRWLGITFGRLLLSLSQLPIMTILNVEAEKFGLEYHEMDALGRKFDRYVYFSPGFVPLQSSDVIPSNYIRLGPMLPNKPIDLKAQKEFEEYLSNGPPIFYVSMGSLTTFTTEVLNTLYRQFITPNNNQFRVLWSLRSRHVKNIENYDKNNDILRIEDWLPQKYILEHENVLGFYVMVDSEV
eukprot:UN31620